MAIYDTNIQHGEGDDPDGLPAVIARAVARAGGSPATGAAESTWHNAFQVRRETLLNARDKATQRAWRESVSRVDVLADIAGQGNYDSAARSQWWSTAIPLRLLRPE